MLLSTDGGGGVRPHKPKPPKRSANALTPFFSGQPSKPSNAIATLMGSLSSGSHNSDTAANPDRKPIVNRASGPVGQNSPSNSSIHHYGRKFGYGFHGIQMPIAGTTLQDLSDSYGPRIHPITGRASFHTGMDFPSGLGTPVRAVVGGVVTSAKSGDSVYGNQVILDHGRNKSTMYGHMENFTVEPGQKVKRGDIIGYVGSTGMSTGPHLHFETWRRGRPVSPAEIFKMHSEDAMSSRTYNDPDLSDWSHPNNSAHPGRDLASNAGYPQAPVPSSAAPYRQPGSSAQVQPMAHHEYGQTSGDLGAFLQAIAQQESGGNYGALGVPTSSGRALGKYQILDSNIVGPGGWDQEALGKEITAAQFLSTPQYQEQIAKAKLSAYFKQYGAAGAAKAWYAGPGNANSMSDSPQYGGPSIVDYANSVLAHMNQFK